MSPDWERNIKAIIAYDGTEYHGFQRQPNGLTVQQVLEERLAPIFGHKLKIAGAGRTDAGVHAMGQVVSFLTAGTIPVSRIPLAAKAVLPPDIVVLKAEEVHLKFHARFSARSKIYLYRMLISPLPDPFMRNYAWHLQQPLDIEAINTAMQAIIGSHDFSAFRASGGALSNPVRTVFSATCTQRGELAEFEFWGTGFLYHMVRNLVGTLVDVGRSRLTEENFRQILAGRDRKRAGITAPPQGLYLKEVRY